MKVALTVWEDRISPVLDTARSAVIAEIEDGKFLSRQVMTFDDDSAQGKIARLRSLGVEVLVCGAVSRPLADMLCSCGIRLFPFVSGNVSDVLDAVIAGKMPNAMFAMPGCGCGRGRQLRARRGGCERNPGRTVNKIPDEKENH